MGYQPARSGGGYGGIIIGVVVGFEYLEVQLTSTLTTGTCYHFEMYINLGNECWFTSDVIGVFLSDTAYVDFQSISKLPLTPQIMNASGNFPDTLNWTLVSANYVASGAENYIIIGNFKDSANTSQIFVNSSGNFYGAICT